MPVCAKLSLDDDVNPGVFFFFFLVNRACVPPINCKLVEEVKEGEGGRRGWKRLAD